MDKNNFIKYGITAAVIILVIAVAVIYFSFKEKPELTQKEVTEEEIGEAELLPPLKAEAPSVAGSLPSIGAGADVVVPEINPMDKANPFKDVYKNPFD